MKTKLLLVLLFAFLCESPSAVAATDYPAGVKQLIQWVSDIDSVITRITDKQKLRSIDRELGYASYDISKIAWGKKYLASQIMSMTNVKDEDKIEELKPFTEDLAQDIDRLISRLWNIRGSLASTDQTQVDKIIKDLADDYKFKKLAYIKDIRGYLYGSAVPLTKIKGEAQDALALAEALSVKVNQAKIKIKAKLN